MATYLDELEEQGAPETEKEQARLIAAEVPGLELTPPTETFTGERDLGGAVAIECGAAHTASDSVVWFPAERVLFTGDLVGVHGHLNLTRGFPPENWLAILDRLAALEPAARRPGPRPARRAGGARHGSPRTSRPSSTSPPTPGDHEMPREYDGWTFPEGFAQNIDALRAR